MIHGRGIDAHFLQKKKQILVYTSFTTFDNSTSLVINQDKQESLLLHNIFNIGSISQEYISLELKNHHYKFENLSFILNHLCAIVDLIQNISKGQVVIINNKKHLWNVIMVNQNIKTLQS